MELILFAGMFAVAWAVYFLPSFVGTWREHRQATAISWLNLLLGWTFVGWVAALVWALTAEDYSRDPQKPLSTADELSKLVTLLEKGHITAEEFSEQKKRILDS